MTKQSGNNLGKKNQELEQSCSMIVRSSVFVQTKFFTLTPYDPVFLVINLFENQKLSKKSAKLSHFKSLLQIIEEASSDKPI